MKEILVVEPNEYSLEYMARIVARLGYFAHQASDIPSAVEVMERRLPDTLVCGTNLSDEELLRLFDELEERSAQVRPPIIAVTSDQNGGFKDRGASAAVDHIVDRPLSIRSFFNSLESSLNNSQRRQIRAPMAIPVTVSSGRQERILETHNFGEGGMYIKTDDPHPGGTEVELTFTLLMGTAPFMVKGQVMHSSPGGDANNPPGMGVMFLHETETLRAVFTIFMENQLALRNPIKISVDELGSAMAV
jgi:uncharacterized protein (TIGR02266 family)